KKGSVELIAIENTSNQFSIPDALNQGIAKATGRILVCCHQDIEFPKGWISKLSNQITEIEESGPKWGVLGTFGIGTDGVPVGNIIDRGIQYKSDNLPCRGQSLDEHCLILKKSNGLKFDEQLGGYHLYGADICLQAQTLSLSNYAIDACLYHNSAAGNKLNESFYQSRDAFVRKWKRNHCPLAVVQTTCTIVQVKSGIASRIKYKYIKQRMRKIREKTENSKIFPTLDMKSKPMGYSGRFRNKMFDFIECQPKKTLEFGCGEGHFSSTVRQKYEAETWAVEIETQAANVASKKLFKVICADVEKALEELPERYFDHIFLFDFLEHLTDPYHFLKRLKSKMCDTGVIVASIPNIRHYRMAIEYLIDGDWMYRSAGILDITHLRFFTYKSILKTFRELGFDVHKIQGINKSRNKKLNLLNVLLFGKLKDMKYLQFVVVASPDQNV
ncbi:MAG: hypothetical protein DRP56_07790, partial [Planctomycetota bacterium]